MTKRSRQRVEAALVLLAFPLAVALTLAIITASDGATESEAGAAATGGSTTAPVADHRSRVAVLGGPAVPAFGLADTLAAKGYDVVAVGPDENSFGSTTQVVYYQRADRGEAERLRDLLGVGTIRREQAFSPSSDMTIIIGKDLQST